MRHKWLQRAFFALLALITPALAGYDIYFQFRAPGLDFHFDHTGLVHDVPFDTYADWAGLHPGDVIQTIDGTPFLEWLDGGWRDLSQGPYMMQVTRRGRAHTIEIPAIPLAQMNALSLSSAVFAALVFWGVGVILLLRRFHQPAVRLLFPLSQSFAVLLLFPLAHPAPSIVPKWAMTLSIASLYVAAPLLLHYYLTFPVVLGTPGPRRKCLLSAIYGLAGLSILLGLSNSPLSRLGAIYVILEIIAAIAVLVYVYARRATPDARRRLRLIVFGNVSAAIAGILFYILPLMSNTSYRMPEWLVALLLIAAPLSYLYATAQHRLFDIDRLLNRALVYGLLSIGILLLYLGPFLLIYRFAPNDLLAQMMVAAGLTLLAGLAFDWSRTQAQRFADRVFYGGWYDYPGVVETISDALACSLKREQLVDVLTRQVPEMMQLRHAQLLFCPPNPPPSQSPNHPPTQFPLIFQDRVHAVWIIGPRQDGDDPNAADRRILQTLARQAEVALGKALLVERLRRQLNELQEVQRQLLHSREEERTRLARDLHDGPIQTLVGLNMQIGLLIAAPSDECSSPDESLTAMRAEVRELLSDLRQVCAELRPPMLDTLGLGAAIRALTHDWSAQSGIPVALDLPPDAALRSLPGDVSVNLYRVAQEALSNVARHAHARQVDIRLLREETRLTLIIEDDGRGFSAPDSLHSLTSQGHFGLVGMQERVELIGGRMTVESAPGQGTTVCVTMEEPSTCAT